MSEFNQQDAQPGQFREDVTDEQLMPEGLGEDTGALDPAQQGGVGEEELGDDLSSDTAAGQQAAGAFDQGAGLDQRGSDLADPQ